MSRCLPKWLKREAGYHDARIAPWRDGCLWPHLPRGVQVRKSKIVICDIISSRLCNFSLDSYRGGPRALESPASAPVPKGQGLLAVLALERESKFEESAVETARSSCARSTRPDLTTSPPSSIRCLVRSRRFTTHSRVSCLACWASNRCLAAAARRSARCVATRFA